MDPDYSISDDVRICMGNQNDEVFSTVGTSDQPSGPPPHPLGVLRYKEEASDGNKQYRQSTSTSDEEEDIFGDDGSYNGDAGAVKPLMHPRKRLKPRTRKVPGYVQRVLWPILYLFLFIGGMGLFIFLVIFLVNVYMDKLLADDTEGNMTVVGCDQVGVEDVWVLGLPKLMTESAIRLLDVNDDGVLDVIMGFATGW